MPDLFLVVGGSRYHGWKAIRVTRSIESIAGSFSLEVSDRWGEDDPWPIAEEDACRVEIDRATVIDGYIGKRDLSLAAESRQLSYAGRDRAAALVDCSAVPSQWTYRNITVADFATALAAPFNVSVSVQPTLTLAKVKKLVVQPGDTVYEAIARAARDAQVLLISDQAGGIILTRAGAARATSLVEGFNIEAASVTYDGDDRFYRYVVMTQTAGTDEASGQSTRILAEATDLGVRRTDRVLIIRPDQGMNLAGARARADWEARTRAARAETVSIVVQGWTQPNGTLWPINALSRVTCPHIGIDGDMLISQVEHSIDDGGGQATQLRLVRPDAFEPEPQTATVSGRTPWLISAGGELREPG